MSTIQTKYKQINTDGSVNIFHFQTNADIVVDGSTKKVPAITDITNWNNIRTEVINARNALDGTVFASLDARLEHMEGDLVANNLLSAIKTVDGSGSGLNADLVDSCEVNDSSAASATVLWTSNKIQTALDTKVDDTEVVTTATASKILRLDSTGKLPTSVTGNAGTATKLATARTVTLGGDLTGSVSFDGSANVTLTAAIVNNSHSHSGVSIIGTTTAENLGTTGNIMDFKINGVTKSSVDANGSFSGSAAKVGGKVVDDAQTSNGYLWTAAKIITMLGGKLDNTDISVLASAQGKLILPGLTIQWGTVDMANKTTAIATYPSAFAAAPLVVLHSDECSDFTWFSKKKPSSTTASQVEFICNKGVATAKISWIAIGAN